MEAVGLIVWVAGSFISPSVSLQQMIIALPFEVEQQNPKGPIKLKKTKRKISPPDVGSTLHHGVI